jgi:triosephosphate isomerase
MRHLIAGNWKMNGTREMAEAMAEAMRQAIGEALEHAAQSLPCDLLICPPATLVQPLSLMLAETGVMVGGQDCHTGIAGAHTGDISAAMLHDAGARFVILGHSERRTDHGETDALVAAKAVAAMAASLTPIICVGETEAQRVAGAQNDVVEAQLRASLPAGFAGVVAYEPIWAIGTGRTPTTEDVARMHAHIRAILISHLGPGGRALRILYGGSVKPGNAAALMGLPDVGGALVGGASLKAADFLAIAHEVG